MTALFDRGEYRLASGRLSNFKIDCDALTDQDWATVAEMLARRLPEFREVVGVPTGGAPLAEQMLTYRQPYADRLLVVDDVWTTGGSWYRYAERFARPAIGAVLFARGPVPAHITALFQMPVPELGS